MAYDEASGYCQMCDRQVMIRRPGTSHAVHAVMTVVTFGVWVLVWIACSIKIGGWRCTRCGSKTAKTMMR